MICSPYKTDFQVLVPQKIRGLSFRPSQSVNCFVSHRPTDPSFWKSKKKKKKKKFLTCCSRIEYLNKKDISLSFTKKKKLF